MYARLQLFAGVHLFKIQAMPAVRNSAGDVIKNCIDGEILAFHDVSFAIQRFMKKKDSAFNIKQYDYRCFTKEGEEIFRGTSVHAAITDDVVVVLSPKERIN